MQCLSNTVYELITKTERFLDFFTAIKCICEPYGAFFTDGKDKFPYLFIYGTSAGELLSFHIPEASKKVPLKSPGYRSFLAALAWLSLKN